MAEGKKAASAPVYAVGEPSADTHRNPFDQQLATGAMTLGTVLSDENRSSSEALSDYARSQAGGMLNSGIEAWFSQFGKVQSQINFNNDFSLSDSSLDWLVPLYDTPKNMLFTQLGMRHKDDRNTVNIGLGARYFPNEKWMYGTNLFFDNDITGHNSRLGLGGEAWADYFKLSANYYQRLSNWHQSRDFEDYDERPANGYDLRINGFLPSYSQLGGKLVYEQYFGDEVALFGKDERQKDPYAVTLGMNYTPIPMLTLGVDQRMGKSGKDDFTVNMEINYLLDKSWDENTSPEAVDALRKLPQSRYDLVERNNNIVLEYRKQQVIKLQVKPGKIQAEGKSTQLIAAQVSSKHGLKGVTWSGGSFMAAGGTITQKDATHYALVLPEYQVAQVAQAAKAKTSSSDASRILNTYVLTAIAEDTKGNKSKSSQLTVEVLPPQATFSGAATVLNDNAPPDGKTPVSVVYTIVDSNKKPVPGEKVTFTATYPDGSTATTTLETDAAGQATLELTSVVEGEVPVVARLDNGDTSNVTVHFNGTIPSEAHSTLKAEPAQIIANGEDSSLVTLTLHDVMDRPLTGLGDVTITASGVEDVAIDSVKETDPGVYATVLSGSKAGTATLTPQVSGTPVGSLHTTVKLVGDSATATLTSLVPVINNALANGKSQNTVKATVKDANGQPVPGQTVTFSTVSGATVTGSGVTNDQGEVTVPVTTMVSGDVDVTATFGSDSATATLTFVADNSAATITSGNLKNVVNGMRANGRDQNKIQALVTDDNNNPVPGVTVAFTTDNSGKVAITSSGVTDEKGEASAVLITNTAGDVNVTATVNKTSQTIVSTFIPDVTSASGTLEKLSDGAIANGSDANVVKVTINDAKGNVLPDIGVTFTTPTPEVRIEQSSGVTDEKGQITTRVSSTKAGTGTLTATADNGETLVTNLSFNPDRDSAAIGRLEVLTNKAAANGTAKNRVVMRVTDSNGNPITDQLVTFSATNGATIPESALTTVQGLAAVGLTNTKAGKSTVSATVNGKTDTVDTTFVGDASTAVGSLSVSANNAKADGVTANHVLVTLKDANDNPLEGVAITFSASNNATAKTPTGTTDSKGQLETDLVSTVAGVSTVTAKAGNDEELSADVTFLADSSTATLNGNLNVLADNAVANGRANNLVQVKVTDQYDNVLSGQTVNFTASNGATIRNSAVTDGSGLAIAELSSAKTGISSVTATVGSSSKKVDTHFIADTSTATGSFSADIDNAKADGTDANSVLLTLKDANNNPIPNIAVAFTAASDVTVVSPSGLTDANGQVKTALKSKLAQTFVITAKAGNGETLTTDVTFKADGSSATILAGNLSVITDNALANGRAQNRVWVKVTDTNGNPLSAQTVKFAATHSAAILASGTTDSRGEVIMSAVSTLAGVSEVTATVNGASQQVDMHFIADKSTGYGVFTVDKDSAVANGSEANHAILTLKDANNNPLAGVSVAFKTDPSVTAQPATGTTDANGKMETTLTSTQAKTTTLTANVEGESLDASLTFIADDSSAEIPSGELKVLTDGAVANGSASNRVQAKVVDGNGNPVPGVDVTFSADNSATITTPVTTNSNGIAIAAVQNTRFGASKITASVNSSTQNTTVNFVADSDTAEIVAGALTMVDNNRPADGVATDSVQATVTDAHGNPIAGTPVSFKATNGAVIAASGTTDSNGQVLMTLVNTKAGTSTVTASVAKGSQSVDANFIADSSTAKLSGITVVANNAKADGLAANRVGVMVTDAKGNKIAGQTVNFSADNGAVIAATGTTNASGLVVMPLTSTKVVTSTVTATINGSTLQASVDFKADGDSAHIPDGKLTRVTDGAVADGVATNSVKAKVVDGNDNAIEGALVTFTANHGAAITASGTTDSNGEVTVTLTNTTAGISTVDATVNGGTQSIESTFVADSSTADILTGNLKVVRNNATANGVSTNSVQVLVTDAHNNAVTHQTVTLSADNGAEIQSSAVTNSRGEATVLLTSTKAGDSKVTATVSGGSQNVTVTFTPDDSTAVIIDGALTRVDDGALANGSATNSVQATVTDAHSNPVSHATVNFSADNGASIASSATTDENGKVTVTLTSTKAGISKVRATVNGSSQTVDSTFIADDSTAEITAAHLRVTKDGALADGQEVNRVALQVTDAQGNALSGQTVNLTASNGATIAATAVTGNNGLVEVPLTSTTPGVSDVMASINGSTQQVSVTFNFDTGSAHIDTLTIVTDNAVANGTDANQVKAVVKDNYNHVIPDMVVNFTATHGATLTASAKSDLNGEVIMPVTSTQAGSSRISAEINGQAKTVNVTFIADESTAQIVAGAMTVVKDGALANGSEVNRVSVHVTDAKGNVVADQTVTFTADNSAVIAATGKTDADGNVVMPLTSSVAGNSKVTASINGSQQSVTVAFVADDSTAQIVDGALIMVTDKAVANGVATDSVQATVTDAKGNRVSATDVAFFADNGAVIASTGTTDANGQVTMTLTNNTAGISTVKAIVSGGQQQVSATFIADSSTATIVEGDIRIIKDGALADGTEVNRVAVRVTDAKGNPVPNQSVAFSADNGATIAATGITNASGLLDMPLTSLTTGASVVTATVNDHSQSVTTTFIADAASAFISALATVTDNALANGVAENQVKATVKDGYQHPLANATVHFTADNDATIAFNGTTDANGEVVMPLTSMIAGISNVTAETNGSALSVDVTFKADGGSAEIAAGNMTITKNGALADGVQYDRVNVVITDAKGNPVPDLSVAFTADNGAVMAASGITDASGNIAMPVTSKVAGDSTVTATVNGKASSVVVSFVPDGNTAQIVNGALTRVTDNAIANGVAKNTVQAIVTDANSNPVPDQEVVFSVTQGATITPVSAKTDASGTVKADITSVIAGAYTVTVTLNGKDNTIGTTFIADVATAHIAEVTLKGTVVNKLANGTDNFVFNARVTDANGNPIPEVTLNWAEDKGPAVTLTHSGVTDATGTATATLTSTKTPAESITVSAAMADGVTVNADKLVSFKARMVTMHGKITNAVDGKAVKDATLKIYANKEDAEAAYELKSDSSGQYSMSIDAGVYYVKVSASGFIDMDSDIDVEDVTDYEKNFALSPKLDGKAARIVLTWESRPQDLDSYLWVPKSNKPTSKIKIYYGDKHPSGADANLDLDDISSYGPETITIEKMHSGSYCYAVNRYSNSPQNMKGAKVKLYLSDGRVFDYAWDEASGSAAAANWSVFKLDTTGDTIKVVTDNKRQGGSKGSCG